MNYNKQQQAVILKGIAQQILSMSVPSFEELDKLTSEFISKETTNQYVVFAFDDVDSPSEWNYNPLGGYFYKFANSQNEAMKLAEDSRNEWGKSLGDKYNSTLTKSCKRALQATFIAGYSKNGRDFEAHERPNWL